MNKFSLALDSLTILDVDCILNMHIDGISPEVAKLNILFYSFLNWNYQWREDQILFFSLISHLSDKDLEECFPEIFPLLPISS